MKIEVLNALKIVITTFICSAIIMPFMIKIAKHVGALDVPRSDEGNRHIHTKTTPYFGGLGVFLSFLLGYMIFGTPSIRMNSILIGSFIVILTGITDDIAPIKSWQKLIGHLIAASVIVFYGNITLNNITAFGFNLDFGIFAYPLTIFFIVACANIINLIDGLDGLSGGICSIFFLTIGIIGLYQGRSGSLVMILTFIMLGATLGFLLYNFHNAKIFAGDCSTFLGFIIAIISLLEFKGPALTSFFVPITILAIPILDTLFAIIRRTLKGKPIFSADKQHLHHQLLGMNFSPTVTVIIIYVIDILFSLATILFMIQDHTIGIIIYLVLFVAMLWFVFHTSIISDKSPKLVKSIEEKIKSPKKKSNVSTKLTKENKKDNSQNKPKKSKNTKVTTKNKRHKALSFEYNHIFHKIEFRDIVNIEKEQDSKRCIIRTTYGTIYMPGTLNDIISKLDDRFLKVHRSLIVNKDKIVKYNPKLNKLEFNDGSFTHLISRRKKKELMKCD